MFTKTGSLNGEMRSILSRTTSLFDCITASNANMDKVYKLVQNVNEAVKVAHTKISEY